MSEREGPARRHPRRERGAVAVEFGLIMPILLLLVFGLIQYGLYFLAYQSGSDAVRSAARKAAVGQLPSCAAFRSDTAGQVASVGRDVVVTRTYRAGADGRLEIGDDVDVTVSFKSTDLHMPFIPFVQDGVVSTRATARVEYLPSGAGATCS